MLPLIIVSFGCSKKEESITTAQPSTPPNRFELVQLGSMRRDQYLLDKQTGQIWTVTCMSSSSKSGPECDYTAWMKADVEGITIDREAIYSWTKAIEEKKARK